MCLLIILRVQFRDQHDGIGCQAATYDADIQTASSNPVAPLPIQLPANVPGEVMESGPSTWAPAPM